MHTLKKLATIGLILALPYSLNASDEQKSAPVSPKKTDSTTAGTQASVNKPVYKPPLRGAPAGRVGGGTRGSTERESFSLMVLAPDHLGYTTRDQPCLYWYISKHTTHPVEITITERNAIKPLIEKIIDGPETGGIQSLCLSEFGVHLRRDVQYKWFVTLVTDPDQRSKDILAGGMLTQISASDSLVERLKMVEPLRLPFVYAEEGLWYDAVEEMSRLIETSPNDSALREQLASLLEQVGLVEVADFGQSRQQ